MIDFNQIKMDLVEQLDIRVGKVLTAENHPDADSM